MSDAAYERLGIGYASTRREDRAIAARIEAALGDAETDRQRRRRGRLL